MKILEAFRLPLAIDGRETFVTTSIGIAVFPDDGEDVEALVKKADFAMYEAKKAGRNRFEYFRQPVGDVCETASEKGI